MAVGDWHATRPIGPLKAWLFTYKEKKSGEQYSIILYGVDPQDMISWHRWELPQMKCEGIIEGFVEG